MSKARYGSTRRSPYMQIARKILQTHEQRKSDIKAAKSDLLRLQRGQPVKNDALIADLSGFLQSGHTISPAEKMKKIEDYIDGLEAWYTLVDTALDVATADIQDAFVRRQTRTALLRMYGDYQKEDLQHTGYPLSRADYEKRSRRLLKQILRGAGLLPYSRPIRDK